MNAHDLAVQVASANGGRVQRTSTGWLVCCPAHEDATPSLSVSEGSDGKVLLHCFAGCPTDDVVASMNMTYEALGSTNTDRPAEHEIKYDYTLTDGSLLFQVVRRPGKKFLQRRMGANGDWIWNLQGVTRVLYRMPAVMAAVAAGEMIWIAEGEKDADYLVRAGVCGTTMSGGAGRWQDSYSRLLEGANVTIWADKDEPGWKHAHHVCDSLILYGAASVRIVESAYGKDAADHLSHGLTLDDVMVTQPAELADDPTMFLRAEEFLQQARESREWAIPHLMRRGERMILTGYEGYGKSALLKQIAVCAAVGLNPFTRFVQPDGPKRVVFIDCENPMQDMLEDFSRLRNAAISDGAWDDPDLFIECHPPMNLGDLPEAVWLAERARIHKPDLLVIGPLYNLMNGDSAKEVEVNRLLRVLAAVQVEVGCALLIEHHVPHAHDGDERTVRPIGSSVLQRWPSFGFGLVPTDKEDPMNHPFDFRSWRGVRRRGRAWPYFLAQKPDVFSVDYEDRGWYWTEVEPT